MLAYYIVNVQNNNIYIYIYIYIYINYIYYNYIIMMHPVSGIISVRRPPGII